MYDIFSGFGPLLLKKICALAFFLSDLLLLSSNQSSICSSISSIEVPGSYDGIYAFVSAAVYTGNSGLGFLTLGFFSSAKQAWVSH